MTDRTSAKRQSRRQAALDAIAQQAGYATWRKLETAALRGEVVIARPQPVDNQTIDNDA